MRHPLKYEALTADSMTFLSNPPSLPGGPYCHNCPHQALGGRFIEPDGSGTTGILVVGDSPWLDEIAKGRNFSGPAGYTYDRILSLVEMSRADLLTANTLWCKPMRLHWMDHPERYADAREAIEHCRPNLDNLIEHARPKVIVPLGNVALRRVCGVSGIEAHAGYVVPTPYGINAVPTFHPSFIMQGNQKLNAAAVFAFNRAREIADGTYQASHYHLLLDPPYSVARDYLASVPERIPFLVGDIETPESAKIDEEEIEQAGVSWTIVRAGFSLRKGTAITFPWQPPYIDLFQEALDRADAFVEHADNHFDSKRLRAAGLRLPRRIISSMWAWHWLESDLRKGLGAVAPFFYAGRPWKDEAQAQPAWYNAMDNAVTWDVFEGTRAILERTGRWEGFVRHCIDVGDPYQVMGLRGLNIDAERQRVFMEKLEAEWDVKFAQLQTEVPDVVKKRKYWKRAPKNMEGIIEIPPTDVS